MTISMQAINSAMKVNVINEEYLTHRFEVYSLVWKSLFWAAAPRMAFP